MSGWLKCFSCVKFHDAEPSIQMLDFSHQTLTDVPADIFQYERTLEELHLYANRINDLPRQLFLCHGLRLLNLNDNEMKSLPAAIGTLINLHRLYVARNSLSSLPDTIKNCKNLTHLDLSTNNLERLPDAVTALTALEELYLNDTLLEYLPANFGRLVNLRILELRENNLITLPKSIARLVNLQRIDLGQNEFTELPEIVGQLHALTELLIDCNRIRRISSSVGNLRNLIHFEASGNLLSQLPPEIGEWQSLEELSLSANELESLPHTIGRLKSLTTFRCDENQLEDLPDSLGQMSALEELIVSHNDLFRFPPTVGLLRRLRFLTADENFLRHLPNEIASCSALTVLSVRGNKLTTIPPDIGRLTQLRVLDIVNNFVTHLPLSILNLTELAALWISDNQSQPLVQLQREQLAGDNPIRLTCFMLPQSGVGGFSVPPPQPPPSPLMSTAFSLQIASNRLPSLPMAAVALDPKRRRICFAGELPGTNTNGIDQNSSASPGENNPTTAATRLLRSPTPYPKELRLLAKHARQLNNDRSIASAGGNNVSSKLDMENIASINESNNSQLNLSLKRNGTDVLITPPPYHIAKAFTRKSKQDLEIYNNHHRKLIGSNEAEHDSDSPKATSSFFAFHSDPNVGNNAALMTAALKRKQSWPLGDHRNPTVYQVHLQRDHDGHLGFDITKSCSTVSSYGQPSKLNSGIVGGQTNETATNNGILVTLVDPNHHSAAEHLRPNDKILDVDGIDFTRINFEEAIGVLSNVGPTVSLMISRLV